MMQVGAVASQLRNTEPAFDLDPACCNQCGKSYAEFTASYELVIGPAAEGFCRIVGAQ